MVPRGYPPNFHPPKTHLLLYVEVQIYNIYIYTYGELAQKPFMKLQAAMMNHHLQSTCIFVIRKYDLHPVRPPKALYPNLGGLHHTAAYLRRFCRGGSSPVGPVTFQTIQITEVGTAALPVKLCLLCLLRGELGGWREEASKLVILG